MLPFTGVSHILYVDRYARSRAFDAARGCECYAHGPTSGKAPPPKPQRVFSAANSAFQRKRNLHGLGILILMVHSALSRRVGAS